jgi:hypothetical protein
MGLGQNVKQQTFDKVGQPWLDGTPNWQIGKIGKMPNWQMCYRNQLHEANVPRPPTPTLLLITPQQALLLDSPTIEQ